MDRRRFLVTSCCAFLPFVSGCLNDPGREGGLLEVLETEKPPNVTVTNASDDRLQELTALQTGVQQAYTGNGAAELAVSAREYDTVAQTLEALPLYDRTNHNTIHISGIYLRYHDTGFVVVLTPFCSDSWIIDTHSERGTYGWGGCIDPNDY